MKRVGLTCLALGYLCGLLVTSAEGLEIERAPGARAALRDYQRFNKPSPLLPRQHERANMQRPALRDYMSKEAVTESDPQQLQPYALNG